MAALRLLLGGRGGRVGVRVSEEWVYILWRAGVSELTQSALSSRH